MPLLPPLPVAAPRARILAHHGEKRARRAGKVNYAARRCRNLLRQSVAVCHNFIAARVEPRNYKIERGLVPGTVKLCSVSFGASFAKAPPPSPIASRPASAPFRLALPVQAAAFRPLRRRTSRLESNPFPASPSDVRQCAMLQSLHTMFYPKRGGSGYVTPLNSFSWPSPPPIAVTAASFG